jgi:hypothetical protein
MCINARANTAAHALAMEDAGWAPLHKRRTLLKAAAGALTLLAVPKTLARMPLLNGTEPDAVTLEFVPDATLIDPVARPGFEPGSRCSECYFFQGRSTDAAPCTVFTGYRVPATGWCREFARRQRS